MPIESGRPTDFKTWRLKSQFYFLADIDTDTKIPKLMSGFQKSFKKILKKKNQVVE